MLTKELIDPKSIVVIGASNALNKPGGKVLFNLKDGNYKGDLYVVNPKEKEIQGIPSFNSVKDLPSTDLAIIAIAAKFCLESVEILASEKNTKGFIILSAGFSEENEEGKKLEQEITKVITAHGGSLIGPNCIGLLNQHYSGLFTSPIPKLTHDGCDLISGSGATAIFLLECSISKGLTFAGIYSVGNSAQIGVEEVLQHLDETYDPGTSAPVKLIYIETVKKPALFLKHTSSLIRKGCKIAAIKSGSSVAGSRAASSHTGALATSDIFVSALFKKAGIVRCYSKEELITVGSVMLHKKLTGKNIAVITHAGGPAVMLTDSLSNGGLNVPSLEGPKADLLLKKLIPGSSVANPIDFLATGTAEQFSEIIEFCEAECPDIDAMIVIYGNPGLSSVHDAYEVLNDKMHVCKKPIYPVLPSLINASAEIQEFVSFGHINFTDEVVLGNALCKIFNTPEPEFEVEPAFKVDELAIRRIIEEANDGYLEPIHLQGLLDAAGICRAAEYVATDKEAALKAFVEMNGPIVMKVVGPVHKTDVGGVVLNVNSKEQLGAEFDRMMQIKDTHAVLLQPMLSGIELYIGAKKEPQFGHLILCGLGGVFIEVLKDISYGLAPLSIKTAQGMVQSLKAYDLIKGVRGQKGVNEELFVEMIVRLGELLRYAPEIEELDLNPLLGTPTQVIAVDARIKVKKL